MLKRWREIRQQECRVSLQLKPCKPRRNKSKWTPQTKTIKYSKLPFSGNPKEQYYVLCCLGRNLSRAFPVLHLPALKVLPGFSVLKFCSGGLLGNLCSRVTKCLHTFRHRPQNRTQRCFLLRKKVSLDCRGNNHRQSRLLCLAPELLFPSHAQQVAMDGAWLCFLCSLQILLFDQTVDCSFFFYF